jgi:hypothetical protein
LAEDVFAPLLDMAAYSPNEETQTLVAPAVGFFFTGLVVVLAVEDVRSVREYAA